MGVDDDVAALGALIAMAARRPHAHLHAGYRRAQHVMRVVSVDDVVSQVIFEKGRLPVAACLADGPDIGVAVAGPFVERDWDAAVLDIADVAVMQRVEMGDVEQVLDQQQRVGGDRHRPGISSFPCRVGNLRQARRPDGLGSGRVARPHPDEPVLLDDRKRTQSRLRRNAAVGMGRHSDTPAGGVVAQAVIRAFEQVAFDQPPLGERHPLVAAPLVERNDAPRRGSPHDQRLFRDDLTLQLLRGEFVGQPGDVPSVPHQHVSSHDCGSLRRHFSLIFRMRCLSNILSFMG